MPEKIVPVTPAAVAGAVNDPRDAELAELRAEKAAHELAVKNERRARRDDVIAKHSKRLSPATMQAMSASLEPVEDADKVDAILSRLKDEVSPRAPDAPAATATSPAIGKKDDPEGELIDLAHARLKERGLGGAKLQDAMLEIMKERPELKARVTRQRASYHIPTAPPPDANR